MFRVLRPTLSCLLALAYVALAMFGHAWHDHDHCHAVACYGTACDSAAACDVPAADACGCGCECPSPASGSSTASLAAGEAHDGQHDCLACQAISHLKVGYCVLPTLYQTATLTSSADDPHDTAWPDALPLVNGPRGPPVRG